MAADDAAVTVTLRADLKGYEAALKSAVRMAERAAKAAEDAVGNVGKGGKGGGTNAINDNFRKSANQIANDARMLQFQLNDIFSGIASGQGIRAVQQQLGQIAQQLGGGGLAQGARTLGSAMVAMVNPINLAVVAFGILATVAASYFFESEDSAKKTTDAIRKQADAAKKLADAWGDMIPGLRQIASEAEAIVKQMELLEAAGLVVDKRMTKVNERFADLADKFPSDASYAFRTALEEVDTAADKMFKTIEDGGDDTDAFNKFQSEMADILLSEGVKANKALEAALLDLLKTYQDLRKAAKEFREEAETQINPPAVGPGRGGDPMPAYRRHGAELDAALGNAANAIDSFVERVIQAESGGSATAKNPLSSATGAGQFISSTWLEVFKRNFAAEAAGMSDAAILELRTDVETNRRMIRAYATENAQLLLQAGQEVNEAALQLAHFLGAGGAIKVLQAAPGTKIANIPGMSAAIAANPSILGGGATREDVLAYAGRRAGASTTPKLSEQERALKNLQEWNVASAERVRIEKEVSNINAQVWLTESERTAQVEALRIAEEELFRLRQAGVPVTAEMERQIRATAQATAEATLKSQQAAELQKQFVENQKNAAAELAQINQQFAGIIGGGLSGFINDLIAGKDAGDAFASMLQRITSQLVDMMVQLLIIKPLMTALGGGIGGGSILGFEGGGTVGLSGQPAGKRPAALWANAPRYAAGGMVGLKPGEVPIIAHRGEIIVPNARRLASSTGGGKVDNSVHQQNKISIDMSGSGYVAANSKSAKQVGENIQKLIQAELVRESRPGGLLRKVPG